MSADDNRYLKLQATLSPREIDNRLRQDANFIVDGACNPVALALVLADMTQYLSRTGTTGHAGVTEHPAVRLVLDQLCVIVFGKNVAEAADYQACAFGLAATV